MPHNGGMSQVNLGFPQVGGVYPFINHLKTAQSWSYITGNGGVSPNDLDPNGYPTVINSGGVYTRFYIPSAASRPGNWKCRWVGGGPGATIYTNFTGSTVLTGSKTGANGFFTCRPTTQEINLGISAIDGTPITKLEFFHVDDENDLDAGELFSPLFMDTMRAAKFGVIRFIDWLYTNVSTVAFWSHQKPVDYVFYDGYEMRSSLFAGATTNSGDDYSITFGTGAPTDKLAIIVKFNAAQVGASPTMNLNGTGAVPIKAPNAQTLDASVPIKANRYAILIYDHDLNVWLKRGADDRIYSVGMHAGVPVSVCVRLCNELGAHPWFNVPYLALDPLTDYTTSLATYCRDNLASGLVPRFEPSNEAPWNTFVDFECGPYATSKATAAWGVAAGNDWYGRALSRMGQAISAVYGNDRSRYQVMCNVQTTTSASASASDAKLTSPRFVADGGSAAKNWATHVAPANYIGPRYTVTEELAAAFEYSTAGEARKAEILEEYVSVNSLDQFATHALLWKAWAEGHGVMGGAPYEGGWSPDYPASNSTGAISAITKASSAVVTVGASNAVPPVGSSVSFASVGGMTELNGNTYTVTENDDALHKFTIDVNSSGFGDFTSGGTATYVNSRTNRISLRDASVGAPALLSITQINMKNCTDAGFENVSMYCLGGYDFAISHPLAWSVLRPDIYVSEPSQLTAHRLFNARLRRKRVSVT